MTTAEKIAQEREKMFDKSSFLDKIEYADTQLKYLEHQAKDTEIKELEIHDMWTKYSEL